MGKDERRRPAAAGSSEHRFGASQVRARTGERVKQRTGLMVGVFVAVTAVVSIVGFWLQHRYAIAWWAFNLGSFGPFAGGLAVLMLNRRLALGAVWRPGLGLSVQLIRRSLLMAGVALAIVLACVQFYTFFRWQMKPIDLARVPHPLAMPGDVATIFGFVALAMLIGLTLEEFGWRTVLEPSLRQRYPVVTTAVVVGVIWASWSWPVWQAGLGRYAMQGSLLELGLFLLCHYVICVSVSLILVLVHNRMRIGNWACAVAFRLVFGLGFFLILDEEQGRWQPMFAISLTSALAALVGLYYYRRAVVANRPRPARDRSSAVPVPNDSEDASKSH